MSNFKDYLRQSLREYKALGPFPVHQSADGQSKLPPTRATENMPSDTIGDGDGGFDNESGKPYPFLPEDVLPSWWCEIFGCADNPADWPYDYLEYLQWLEDMYEALGGAFGEGMKWSFQELLERMLRMGNCTDAGCQRLLAQYLTWMREAFIEWASQQEPPLTQEQMDHLWNNYPWGDSPWTTPPGLPNTPWPWPPPMNPIPGDWDNPYDWE